MALFDFLKKKITPTQDIEKGVDYPKSVPAAKPEKPVHEQFGDIPKPTKSERPTVSPRQTSGLNSDCTQQQHNQRPVQQLQWPRYGTSVEGLVAAVQIKVFVDASFVKGPAFAPFCQEWKKHRVNQFATRYYFIPSYEKQRLSPEEQQAISGEDCREFSGRDPVDCFAHMVAKGLKWNILWLTESSKQGITAQDAARKTNTIYLRWYGMDVTGKLKSLSVPAVDRSTNRATAWEKAAPTMIFPHSTQLIHVGRTADPARTVPRKDGIVTAPCIGKRYTLQEPVMTDHSSITYKTDDDTYFAKIYTPDALRIDLFENKAKRMVREKINLPGVCWPQDILKDANGRFVGILVPASAGVQLSQSIFSGTSGIQKHFPSWDKRNICSVALTILRTVYALQKLGVIFGCFNPASVYIVSTNRVYFVDADAWQIEGYPVLSRNLTFTPPELLGDQKKVRLFTADEENYQTALLAFMLMMPGKYPYAKKNRKTDDDSLRNMSFPFSIGVDMRRSEDAERPSSAWQIVWDHLPYKLCFNFYNSFHHSGNFSKPGTRLRGYIWIEQIEQFAKSLSTAEGAQSRILFPATFRRDGKRTFVQCKICGKEHPEFYFLRKVRMQGEMINIWDRGYRVCLPCAVDRSNSPDAQFTCKCCGRTYYYTNRTHIMHEIGKLDYDWNAQKWCRDCKKQTIRCTRCHKEVPVYQLKEFRDEQRNQRRSVCGSCFGELINEEKQRKNAVYRTAICRNCNRPFNITQGEKVYFESKGYSMPTRCPSCRGR